MARKAVKITNTKELLRALDRLKVPWTKTRAGHIKVSAPLGPVFFPSTPGDSRGIRDDVCRLRRKGVDFCSLARR